MALTKAQRARLEKLATYLEGLPKSYRHFNMAYWVKANNRDDELRYARENGGIASCGTAACAVGHGPAAGIFVPDEMIRTSRFSTQEFVDWEEYSTLFVGDFGSSEHDWCFKGLWDIYDNHHWGAAARIRYLLKNGSAPEGFNSPARKWRKEYLSYRIDAKAPTNA